MSRVSKSTDPVSNCAPDASADTVVVAASDASPHAATDADADADADVAAAAGQVAPSFEEALEELETIVQRMEGGSLSLDRSLAAYQRGAALVKICETALERAKEQVRVLDGELLRPLSEMPARGADRGSDRG